MRRAWVHHRKHKVSPAFEFCFVCVGWVEGTREKQTQSRRKMWHQIRLLPSITGGTWLLDWRATQALPSAQSSAITKQCHDAAAAASLRNLLLMDKHNVIM